MAIMAGILMPGEQDGITFSVGATSASGNKTFYNNAVLRISCVATAGAAAGVTVTFGQVAQSQLGGLGHAPTAPSATNGYFIPANTQGQDFWLGPNRDSVNFFNNTAGTVVVSIQPMMP